MNISDAKEVKINNKTVQQIKINNNIVYERIQLILSASNSFVYDGGTVLINLLCEKLKNTRIDLYQVVGLTKTKIDTLTTDENGQASYTYTGTGAGEVGFIAEYEGKESNQVTVDDYIQAPTTIELISSSRSVNYGQSVTLSAVVTDQHDQPVSGEIVTFKQGATTLDSATTNSNGIAFIVITLSGGVHTIKAVCGTANSPEITITVNKLNTNLNINVPALVYSDVFNVPGVLKDNNDNPISGATVSLKWTVNNQEYTATADTNSSGEVTFAREAPTSITNYTFKLEYNGDSNYNASASSVVERTVGKETSILNISSPSSPVTVAGSSFNVVGVLTDNDGTPLKGKGVEAYFNYPTIAAQTTTSQSDGSFTLTIPTSSLSDGQHSLRINFHDSSTYTDADVYLTVVKASFDGISLYSDKSILSAEDNEYATLTAQLTADDEPVAIGGETVTFEVRKVSDDSLVETLTAVTTSTYGVATVSYLGKGVGDIYIQASCRTFLTKTYSIHDYWYYTSTAPSRSSTHIGSGYYKEIFDTPINLPSAFELEYTGSITSSGDKMGTIILGETTDNFYYNGTNQTNLMSAISRNGSRAVLSQKQNVVPSSGSMTIKLTYSNGVHTISYGSETLTVSNSEYTPSKLLGFFITKTNTVISEIKVKPL